MAEDFKATQEALIKKLLGDVAGKDTEIAKLKQMTTLAKELGEDTSEADKLLATASDFIATIKKRLGSGK